jgi:hypothetical protein
VEAVQPSCRRYADVLAAPLAVLSDALDDLKSGGLSSTVTHAVAYVVSGPKDGLADATHGNSCMKLLHARSAASFTEHAAQQAGVGTAQQQLSVVATMP